MSKKGHARSIRLRVGLIMAASFAAMCLLLYFSFSASMHAMLAEREEESVRSQADMGRNMLVTSVEHIPNLATEWASLIYTYNYVVGEDDLIYHTHFSQDRSLELNKLNILAVLDLDGNLLFEKLHRYESKTPLEDAGDLLPLYRRFAAQCEDSYARAMAAEDPAGYAMDVSGFAGLDGQVYYISAHPVVYLQGNLPMVGTFIFGRVIDEEELGALGRDSGAVFSVETRQELELSAEEKESLGTTGGFMRADNGVAVGYSSIADYTGEESIFVLATSQRTLYAQGQQLINTIIMVAILGCVVVLLVLLNVLNGMVLTPLVLLAREVGDVDMEEGEGTITPVGKSRELKDLTTAINTMLQRIQADRDLIKKNNESLYYNANYDTLTDLRNSMSATECLREMVQQARRDGGEVTVYYLNLDRFKYVNDVMGHEMGDLLMAQIAARLREAFDDGAMLARMNGDEFMVCINTLQDKLQRQQCASHILDVFDGVFYVKERAVEISASVGSCVFPKDGQDADTLIKNAEIAMYHAKDSGRGLYVPYQSDLNDKLQRKILIENRLRAMVHAGCKELEVYYQPKYSTVTGKIEQCEALIRWNAPEGMIYPDEFIPQAEESGLIVPLTWWLIEECGRQCRRFEEAGMPTAISINVPAQVLLHELLPEVLAATAAKTGADLRKLDIEITERTLLEDVDRVELVFEALHNHGIEISVDDFGTGYSSLSYLHRLSIDRIKIDRSFISNVDADEDGRAIVRAIVAMAKSLQILITAEGVETMEQYRFLEEIECEEIQGYLVTRPLPAEDYMAFVKKWSRDALQ